MQISWKIGERGLTNEGAIAVLSDDKENTRICLVDCHTKFKRGDGWKTKCEIRDINAALIIAAPELLEALKEAERIIAKFQYPDPIPPHNNVVSDTRTKALALIAKAEGR